MLLEGLPSKEIRGRLDEFIRGRLQRGGYGERGGQACTKAVTQIMRCWVVPHRELLGFRDSALAYARDHDGSRRAAPIVIGDRDLASLMLEAALHAASEGRGTLGLLLSSPGFFPFRLPAMTGDLVSRLSGRVAVVRYGRDDELLQLKEKRTVG